MDLYPTDEQRELVTAARAVTRAGAADVWTAATGQGWLALGLPEDAGGLGGSLADEARLYAEIGASAVAGPVLATSTAVRVAASAGRLDLVERLAEGRAGHAFATTGSVVAFDARDADVLLLVDEESGSLRLVPMTDAMVVADLTPLDPAVTAERVDLSGGEVLAEVTGAAAEHELVRAAVLVAAMLAGITNAATDLSVAYAGLREQFGKPIGAFQAISHRCADMAMRARAATAVTDFAAVSVDEHHPDARRRVAAARRHTETAALENTRATIQVHGATGFTWEHDAHRLLKRATFLAAGFLPRTAQTEALTA
ncbi:acyl-CoA dehydrogenase family protein [Actinophytocola gossypii]|uniref:Acyl-CoA/acyl-ACP dehydrogenase n=1 Tax=Actinophytocola gossypii TaxID=2812003 RepID=A0ABT2J423_9PSEU|nr:acyl-CoA dehydrogenase family protein [Actinophytocola gossypii]MCT2582250.1 acyl-CoA/acyl-ACP dehydrogenase [Actinophytocola gossypii]